MTNQNKELIETKQSLNRIESWMALIERVRLYNDNKEINTNAKTIDTETLQFNRSNYG
jgi:hypothetical protein